MTERRPPRVLGAARTLADALTSLPAHDAASCAARVTAALTTTTTTSSGASLSSSAATTATTASAAAAAAAAASASFTMHELELAVQHYSDHNSSYVNVEHDDFQTLVDEVLNNSIRAVLVYDNFSGCFGDVEVCSLSMAFQYNVAVEAVTLSGVDITDESVGMLCDALARSRVGYLDLSNTPLEDDAGHSLAALAHVNPYLRTVVVDDTLIAEDVLDEIDVACQFNQSNYEANGGCIDVSLFSSSDAAVRRRRLLRVVRARALGVHYCVAHLFGCCVNGDLCLYSHALHSSGFADNEDDYADEDSNNNNNNSSSTAAGGGADSSRTRQGSSRTHDGAHGQGRLADKIAALFASGGDWESRLPPPPRAGASWRNPDDDPGTGLHLNLQRRREVLQRRQQQREEQQQRQQQQQQQQQAQGATSQQQERRREQPWRRRRRRAAMAAWSLLTMTAVVVVAAWLGVRRVTTGAHTSPSSLSS